MHRGSRFAHRSNDLQSRPTFGSARLEIVRDRSEDEAVEQSPTFLLAKRPSAAMSEEKRLPFAG